MGSMAGFNAPEALLRRISHTFSLCNRCVENYERNIQYYSKAFLLLNLVSLETIDLYSKMTQKGSFALLSETYERGGEADNRSRYPLQHHSSPNCGDFAHLTK
jgi:hypothetical protein